jgi:CHAT domain-containing protein
VDVLPLFSDTEQLKFLRQNDASNLYRAVSYLMEGQPDANAASQAAEWVMNGKALANELLAEQVWMTRATDQKDVAPIGAELQHVREQLAALTTSKIPDQSARLEQMERLEASRVELTAKLGLAIDRPTQAAQWVELKDIQAKVPENSVLVEFYRFQVWDQLKSTWQGQRYVVFVISGRQNVPIKLVDLGDAELMDAAVSEAKAGFAKSLSTLTETDEGKSEQLARTALVTLSDRLLRPLEQHLVGAENWLISPDSNLWLVPWSALTLASGQYTVESHATTLLVCGRQLLQKSDTVPSTAPVIVADPNFDAGLPNGYQGPKLCTPLPGSAIEARAIAPYIKDFTKAEPQVSLGDSATEQLVKSIKNPSVLVLSTHGFFAESRRGGLRHPLLRCGLTFAGANCPNTDVQSSDGILLGMEIVNTRLQGTQLVVLSACDTAVGDVQSGEGVLGLRQAFHLAGAKQVVSTLWLLTDADTAFIMTELFKELAAGKETSQALRAAQLATIKQRRAARQGAHPFFWAPYTLTGTSTAPSNGS